MVNMVRLACTIEAEVPENTPYSARAEILAKLSRTLRQGGREPGDFDDKFLITKEGLESLIGAGAKVIVLNSEHIGGSYVSQVYYDGRMFIYGSRAPEAFVVEGHRR